LPRALAIAVVKVFFEKSSILLCQRLGMKPSAKVFFKKNKKFLYRGPWEALNKEFI
jgi:hypothetical protein